MKRSTPSQTRKTQSETEGSLPTIGERKVVIVGPQPVQVLDVTGPLEVFSHAEGYDVIIGTPGPERTLQTHRRFALTDAVPISEINGLIDTLVIAGGPGAEAGTYDPALVAWIGDAAKRSRRVASICTGAFLLGAAGLLDGKQVVTHWRFCDRLARKWDLWRCRLRFLV